MPNPNPITTLLSTELYPLLFRVIFNLTSYPGQHTAFLFLRLLSPSPNPPLLSLQAKWLDGTHLRSEIEKCLPVIPLICHLISQSPPLSLKEKP